MTFVILLLLIVSLANQSLLRDPNFVITALRLRRPMILSIDGFYTIYSCFVLLNSVEGRKQQNVSHSCKTNTNTRTEIFTAEEIL